MKIIIPMSGFGERFKAAGYKIPKPLISIQNKPTIGHIVDMFSVIEDEFIFICNEDHIKNNTFNMVETILKFCPNATILPIKSHKLGPVHALMQAVDLISDNEELVVNYADFTCYWSWDLFKKHVHKDNVDASIVAYKGFHPHSLGKTNYAYMKIKNGYVYDIQEKQPYTNNRIEEYAASGTFYFKKGIDFKEALTYTIENNLMVGGEYYLSLSFKYYFKTSKNVSVYPLQHFMQWGTPEDVFEYNYWSALFNSLTLPKEDVGPEIEGTKIVIAAGAGKRFSSFSKIPKPFIEVSGKPMMLQASDSLINFKNSYFSVLKEDFPFSTNYEYNPTNFIMIESLTKGQACTAKKSFEKVVHHENSLVLFASCDNALVYRRKDLNYVIDSMDFDVLVFGAKGYPSAIREPEQYGWIMANEDGEINEILVKKSPKNTKITSIVTGSFLFKNEKIFAEIIKEHLDSKETVNNEYYLDSSINIAINRGYKCIVYNVDHFMCWGTPNDLKTFEYWQSCFSKWQSHKYTLENDPFFNLDKLAKYEERYADFDDNPYGI